MLIFVWNKYKGVFLNISNIRINILNQSFLQCLFSYRVESMWCLPGFLDISSLQEFFERIMNNDPIDPEFFSNDSRFASWEFLQEREDIKNVYSMFHIYCKLLL